VVEEQRSGAQSVERALSVLRCFEHAGDDGLGISEIASQTGLSVSTAHRLTRALVTGGLVAQDDRTERYALGPLVAVLGQRASVRLGYDAALPDLEKLASSTGESVNLGILAPPDEVLVVLDIASAQPLRFDQAPGTRVPVHTSAMGKCLLAFAESPDGAVAALSKLTRFTPRTITSRHALKTELAAVRARGWALNDQERNDGVRAVAAPVVNGRGVAVAAVAVQGPAVRLDDRRVKALTAELADVAVAIAPALGGL
jgi:IclR family acetate operon transcriptional repressor